MKRVLFCVLALVAYCTAAYAQSIIDADNQRNPNDFYVKNITTGKKPMPYPPVRQSDVVWENVVWREIDFNEKFNQFFYFPTKGESSQGRVSLVNLIVRAVREGLIPAYDDDDMEKELDVTEAIKRITGVPRPKRRAMTDEDGNPLYDDETGEVLEEEYTEIPIFDSTTAKKIRIKERWYIDKQDTRQKVRIVGLSFQFDKELVSGEGFAPTWSFWIPMDDMRVRELLCNANAYDENNDVREASYDDVFIQRRFDSYIVRQSNVYNRAITESEGWGKGYLTGEDAILESQRIENYIFDLESDMWEY